MTNTKQLVAAVMVALILASSVLAGLPIADADTPDWDIDRQNPATVAIADRLQPAEGEVTVIARLETPRVMSSTDGMSTKQRLKSHAETSQSDLVAFADRAAGVNVVQRFWLGNAVLLEVNTSRTGLMEVASIQGVERLHPNYEFEIPAPRSGSTEGGGFGQTVDQLASSDGHAYGLEQLSVPDVWQDFGTKGGGTKVAVLDTGVQADHPAIELYTRDESDPTYPGGWAEFDDDGNRVSGSTPHDTGWHGTHTSGTVAGQNVSGVPVFGVAPNAKLMNGLVLSGGNGTFAQIIGGMQWAVEEDADVVSLSMGTLLDPNSDVDLPVSSYLIDPIRDARAAGTYVVVASGNDGNETITSPGGIYDATSIGASDSNREIATFSSGGVVVPNDVWKEPPSDWPSEYVYPDVSAPGVNILSSVPDDGDSTYGYASGTSMAAPHVAGVVALLHSAAENRPSPGEIDTALTETATKPSDALSSKDTRYGEGIVDAYGAVSEVADAPTSSVGVSVSPSQEEMQPDESTTFDVLVQEVDGGVGSYAFSVSISDASVASIEDVSLGGDPVTSDVTVSSDGSSATVEASGANTDDAGDVRVATVTVRGDEAGSSDVGLQVDSIADEAGNAFGISSVSGGTLTVLSPATFAVSGLEPGDYSAGPDEVITVSATVQNTGDIAATKPVELRVDDGETVTTIADTGNELGSGEGTSVEFDLDAGQLAAGEYTYSVWTEDGAATGTLSVAKAPADFAVSGLDPQVATVDGYEFFNITATVENVGNLSGETGVELRVGNETVATQTTALDAGEGTIVEFEVDAGELAAGQYTYSVGTEDDAVTGTLTVEEASIDYRSGGLSGSVNNNEGEPIVATVYVDLITDVETGVRYEIDAVDTMEREAFTVTAVDADSGAELENLTVDAETLRNFAFENFSMDVGLANGTEPFELMTNGSASRYALESVPALESRTVSVRLAAIQRETGTTGQSSRTSIVPGWTRTANIVVDGADPVAGATFSVSALDPKNYTADPNETVTVTANVTNTGDITGETVVELRIDDGDAVETIANTTVGLNGGNSTPVEFEIGTDAFDAGTFNYSVWTEDDAAVGTLTIESRSHWWDSYVNESSVVDQGGLNAAVRDYLANDLSGPHFNALIRSYLTGTSLPLD